MGGGFRGIQFCQGATEFLDLGSQGGTGCGEVGLEFVLHIQAEVGDKLYLFDIELLFNQGHKAAEKLFIFTRHQDFVQGLADLDFHLLPGRAAQAYQAAGQVHAFFHIGVNELLLIPGIVGQMHRKRVSSEIAVELLACKRRVWGNELGHSHQHLIGGVVDSPLVVIQL